MESETSTFSCCAYCWKNENAWDELLHFKCDGCKKKVHYGCIKSDYPSPLLDDTFFSFKCEGCSEDGREDFNRMKLSWQDTVALSLYHLQKTNQGRCGFFHWRGHICAFIDTHWRSLFGLYRKKTNLWMGTVAGTLSTGCPEFFMSGANVVEMGYWRLTHLKPPLPYVEKKKSCPRKKAVTEPPVYLNPEERRSRRPKDNALTAAMELKEKRVAAVTKGKKKSKATLELGESASTTSTSNKVKKPGKKGKNKVNNESSMSAETEGTSETISASDADASYLSDLEDAVSRASSSVTQESSLSSSMVSNSFDDAADAPSSNRLDFLNAIKIEAEDEEDELDIDIGSMGTLDMSDFRPASPDLNSVLGCVSDHTTKAGKSPVAQHRVPPSAVNVKEEPLDPDQVGPDVQLEDASDRDAEESEDSGHEEEESENEEDDDDDDEDRQGREVGKTGGKLGNEPVSKKKGRPRKRRRSDDAPPPSPPPRLKRISVFEERELLQKLNNAAKVQPLKPSLAQLRRKLICNQTNREFGLPVFDLDSQVEKLSRAESAEAVDHFQGGSFFPRLPTKASHAKETRDLDRFMIHDNAAKAKSRTYTTFHQRLVGFEDHELKPVISPYTTRVLLPFIWRNYDPSKKPLKLQLLQEIQAYPHRNDPTWVAPPSPPIDFCYVRPEHIPSVNALCREFFWPGIDLSECLQYPDFSCVVLYRKIVIAFAFMVPDRGYNEAYISFIFTHPEWRRAGIARFMLYHLIQTCMGKDVLLHVSATNTAMLLYQKFGFKAQELILNFYYKYFPYDCRDSTHAFLMRLTR